MNAANVCGSIRHRRLRALETGLGRLAALQCCPKAHPWTSASYLALIVYIISGITKSSYLTEDLVDLSDGYILSLVLLLVSFLTDYRRHAKSALILLLLSAIMSLPSTLGGGKQIIFFVLLAYCLRDEDLQRVLRVVVIATVATGLLIVVLARAGIITNEIGSRGPGTPTRECMGFYSFTYPSKLVMSITLAVLVLWDSRIPGPQLLMLLVTNFYVYFCTDTRNGFGIALLALAYSVSVQVRERFLLRRPSVVSRFLKWDALPAIWTALFVLACALALAYSPDNRLLLQIDKFASHRLSYSHKTFSALGVSLFGRGVEFGSDLRVVDSSYLRLLIDYGMSGTAIVLVLMTRLTRRAQSAGNSTLLLALLLSAAYCLFDPNIVTLYISPFFLLVFIRGL